MALNYRLGDVMVEVTNRAPDIMLYSLFEELKLMHNAPSDEFAFCSELIYGVGDDRQSVTLLPGESFTMPQSQSKEVLGEVTRKGLPWSICPVDAPERDKLDAARKAVFSCYQHYRVLGSKTVEVATYKHELTDEGTLKRYQYEHPGPWINELRETLMKQLLDDIENDIAEARGRGEKASGKNAKAVVGSERRDQAKAS